jgi:4-amino-4-deoxy-L-arabinose transferase-like glycosyltransferase
VGVTSSHSSPQPPIVNGRLREQPLWPTILIGLLAGMALIAATTPFLGRYGWDRDELYFLSATHHLALGYVDFPPITALIGWAIRGLAGNSLDALRLTSLAAGFASVLVVALMARELGGGLGAQLLSALVWALSPYILGSASIFHPTWFDMLAWVSFLYVALRILGRPQPRLWPLLGLIAGIGLETKYTIAALGLGLAVGLLATPERRQLRTPGPWVALAIAVALLAPNLIWQIQHGWPTLHFLSSQNAKTAADTSRPAYLAEQILFLASGSIAAMFGVVWMWRRPQLRPLAIIPLFVTALFLVERGRAYYPLPADSLAIAAGIVALLAWLQAGSRLRLALVPALLAVQVGLMVLAVPIVVPVLPTATMVRDEVWKPGFYDDEIGWPELAAQAARAWNELPARERQQAVLLARNYGEASGLALYGPARGLPQPLSGHLSWQYWRPPRLPQPFALIIRLLRLGTSTPLLLLENSGADREPLANRE